MNVYGIDFTSAPTHRKRITCLECGLDGDLLTAGTLHEWPTFDGFEDMLRHPGPWIAGMDFPFGQARKFIETIGWPSTWGGYVDHVGTLTRQEFRTALDTYRANRPSGDKEHRRKTDIAAGSISPQKLYGTPVGLMFFEGATRLRTARVTIPGLQTGDSTRIVLETYPGVLARHLIGRHSYKQDTKKKQTDEQQSARQSLIQTLFGNKLQDAYGLQIKAPLYLADDPTGDQLDALLCAIQAAWGWRNRDHAYGSSRDFDPLEGWIADPIVQQTNDTFNPH